jgi:uncharacterized protein YbaR (Trm112 family)
MPADRLRALASAGATALRELASIPRQASRHRPRPPRTGLVLEVGGGQDPHPRANVVVDKYVADSFERAGEAELDLSKPLVVADGHNLPFADGSFAYVIAFHVLEHATEPVRFAAELSRVARGGFVQVPTREAELTFGWPYHPWLIDRVGESLVFSPKGDQRTPLGQTFHEAFDKSPLMRAWWAANRSLWHHSMEWQGELSVRVEGSSEAERTAQLDVEETVSRLEALSARGALLPLDEETRRALRCPACGGTLVWERTRITCDQCSRDYPVVGGIPVLVEEATIPV